MRYFSGALSRVRALAPVSGREWAWVGGVRGGRGREREGCFGKSQIVAPEKSRVVARLSRVVAGCRATSASSTCDMSRDVAPSVGACFAARLAAMRALSAARFRSIDATLGSLDRAFASATAAISSTDRPLVANRRIASAVRLTRCRAMWIDSTLYLHCHADALICALDFSPPTGCGLRRRLACGYAAAVVSSSFPRAEPIVKAP